eukprot:scaffold1669_cov47-Attheya_sp.AAC.2
MSLGMTRKRLPFARRAFRRKVILIHFIACVLFENRETKFCHGKKMDLHYLILRAATTLWDSPINIFMGHFNAAALAMNTILIEGNN